MLSFVQIKIPFDRGSTLKIRGVAVRRISWFGREVLPQLEESGVVDFVNLNLILPREEPIFTTVSAAALLKFTRLLSILLLYTYYFYHTHICSILYRKKLSRISFRQSSLRVSCERIEIDAFGGDGNFCQGHSPFYSARIPQLGTFRRRRTERKVAFIYILLSFVYTVASPTTPRTKCETCSCQRDMEQQKAQDRRYSDTHRTLSVSVPSAHTTLLSVFRPFVRSVYFCSAPRTLRKKTLGFLSKKTFRLK